ncbi:thioredoxin domain-containing protein [Candidatus Peregrinibacteria bacterium]|nr:thioredoxin domain-containing protein [Candidatus Peregrinibacteria bacterium]
MNEYDDTATIWRTIGLILIGVLIGYIVGRFELTSLSFERNNNTHSAQQTIQPDNAKEKEEEKETIISIDDDAMLGSEDAPITIINFSDYQCPFCEKFYTEIFSQLNEDYIQEGTVRYVYRDFPLSIHPQAQYAHYAAECARDQQSYWEMHNKLFEQQEQWTEKENLMEEFNAYAQELNLNKATFEECMSSEKYRDEIAKDRQDALSYGFKGTPTLVVNGTILRGITTYEELQEVIEKTL